MGLQDTKKRSVEIFLVSSPAKLGPEYISCYIADYILQNIIQNNPCLIRTWRQKQTRESLAGDAAVSPRSRLRRPYRPGGRGMAV